MKERKIFQPATSSDICQTYELLLSGGFVSFPITQESVRKIDALTSNINSSHYGKEIYATIGEKVVAYLYFLIKNHPFTDGNKRTASLVFATLCNTNGLIPRYTDFALDELAVFVEKTQTENHQDFIRDLSKLLFDSDL